MFNAKKLENDKMDKFRGMLEDYNIANGIVDNFVELSESQERVLEIFKSGRNVAMMGPGGVGKSFLIREMRYQSERLWPLKRIVVTATTGIAAYNLSNAVTINSFLGIGTGEQSIEGIIKRVRKKFVVRERINSTDIIIIDEVSMMSAELFEKMNTLLQTIRKSKAPFGGIQVVLSFDLKQLLPVFNRQNFWNNTEQDTRLIFESPTFTRYFTSANTIQLKKNFRQTDAVFRDMLMRIRDGEQTERDIEMLRGRLITKLTVKPSDKELEDAVHLVTSNKQAQIINLSNLNNLKSKEVRYKSEFVENGDSEVCADLTKDLHNQFEQKGINEICLKKGARVMLLKNINVEEGLVNGSVGTIENFSLEGFPVVKFDNGVLREIVPVEWEVEYGDNTTKAIQVPLMLCWAITCHKSQSLTLDKAVMCLDSAFCDHMIYVALSRMRTLEGLYLESFDPKKITINEKVKKYLSTI